ncbi:MAG: VWA domain-containing protein, partial [Desulfurococcaceae archaeon]|nr:VWA domain-containing protein [Desulfurococcaceae archaeon]
MSKGFLLGVDYGDPVIQYRGEKIVKLSSKLGLRKEFITAELATDFFYTLYLPHALVVEGSEVDNLHYNLIKALNESEELLKIKKYTILDSFISTLTTIAILQYFTEFLEDKREFINVRESRSAQNEVLRSALRESLKSVAQEVETMKKLERLYTAGLQPGVGSEFDLEEDAEKVLKLAKTADVSKILEVLSLIPDVVRKTKKKYERFNRGEFNGYDLGSDLERLVPTQLAFPREYILLSYVESKLLLYDKKISKSLGPLYLLIDKSGSMEGEKIEWAKATAIALLIKSRREVREFYLRFFDGAPHELIRVSRKASFSEFLSLVRNLARVKSGGGTDITKAITTACDDIIGSGVVKRDSDVVVITDGEDTLSVTTLRRKLRQANARLFSVMIQGDNKDLKVLSEKYLTVST